jgi:catechol 2,3-dioxygenase-like lactoylglutathione lyase family enzyme
MRGHDEGKLTMIDHISVSVSDLDRSAEFYETVLGALGYQKLETRPATIAFGKKYPEFWINHRPWMKKVEDDSGMHIALRASSQEMVDTFHAVALKAGGTSDGEAGLRPQHGEGYYAAFIRDPDGNRIEAVTFVK